MASGVPTVAPRFGGILSYATDDNAWLVELTGIAFAEAIQNVIRDDTETLRRTNNALETARQNSREAATDRLFDTYDRIYEDFHSRKHLFTNIEKSERFDYNKLGNV
jgi:glycosyltransferase involved in cell wall biosynthesis